jgi:hypothetical protein
MNDGKHPVHPSDTARRAGPDDDTVRAANEKGRMGPGEHAGGYAGQRFDTDRHGGTYGGNASSGGSHVDQPGMHGARSIARGQQHMAGRYGDQAYGRLDAGDAGIPIDPSQHRAAPVDGGSTSSARTSPMAAGGARPADEGQNAQISSGEPSATIGRGTENERNSPGISTDKTSDDTKI